MGRCSQECSSIEGSEAHRPWQPRWLQSTRTAQRTCVWAVPHSTPKVRQRVRKTEGNVIDSRLKQATALLDDARTLLVDIVDSRPLGPLLQDFNNIDAARQFINSAIVYVQAADSEETPS